MNDSETTIITGTTSPAADSTEVTHSNSVLSKAVKTLLTPDNFAEKHVGPRRQSSHTPTCTDSSLTTPISSRNLSLLNRHSPIHKSPSPSSISHTSTLPPIIVHTSPNLKFNSQNVDIFFHTFEAHYFGKNLTDEQLYYELVKCLNTEHMCRVFAHIEEPSVHSYATLKAALTNIYTVPLHQKFQKLSDAPAMGDRTPSQLLADLTSILGHPYELDDTATWLLRTEFLQRLPANARTILSAFSSQSLQDLAQKADSIMLHERRSVSSSSFPQDDVLSYMVRELSSLKSEIAHLRNEPTPKTSENATNSSALSSFSSPTSVIHPAPSPLSRHIAPPSTASPQLQTRPPSLQRPPRFPSGPNLSLPGRSELTNGMCYYHHKHGLNARYCIPGCHQFHTLRQPLNYQRDAPVPTHPRR